MKFDPIAELDSQQKFSLRFTENTEYDSNRPMGNVAATELNCFILGILVGLDQSYLRLVASRIEWLRLAILEHEELRFGSSACHHLSTILRALALYQWLQDGSIATDVYHQASVAYRQALLVERSALPETQIPSSGMDNYMSLALLGRQHESAIELYRSLNPHKGLPLTNGTPRPGHLAYAMCVQAKDGSMDSQHIYRLGCKMLRQHLAGTWLDHGRAVQAAIWLKIVHGLHCPGLAPQQIILRAYDDLPHVQRPDSIGPPM